MKDIFLNWFVAKDEDNRAIAVARRAVGPNVGSLGRDVAHKPARMSLDDWDATANLIAAAPALLSALKAMVVSNKPFTMMPIGFEGSPARLEQDEQKRVYALALEAIAKAEGRT